MVEQFEYARLELRAAEPDILSTVATSKLRPWVGRELNMAWMSIIRALQLTVWIRARDHPALIVSFVCCVPRLSKLLARIEKVPQPPNATDTAH